MYFLGYFVRVFSANNDQSLSAPTGIGIYLNTSTGLAHIHDCHVRSNGADGIKFVLHDTQIPRREVDGSAVTDFCSSGTIAQQIYPIFTVAQQFKTSYRPIQCQKVGGGRGEGEG